MYSVSHAATSSHFSVPDLKNKVQDLGTKVPDPKLEVPDLRSGGIRLNLTPGPDPRIIGPSDYRYITVLVITRCR